MHAATHRRVALGVNDEARTDVSKKQVPRSSVATNITVRLQVCSRGMFVSTMPLSLYPMCVGASCGAQLRMHYMHWPWCMACDAHHKVRGAPMLGRSGLAPLNECIYPGVHVRSSTRALRSGAPVVCPLA